MNIHSLKDTVESEGVTVSDVTYDGFNFEMTNDEGCVTEVLVSEVDGKFRIHINYADNTNEVRNRIPYDDAVEMLWTVTDGKDSAYGVDSR